MTAIAALALLALSACGRNGEEYTEATPEPTPQVNGPNGGQTGELTLERLSTTIVRAGLFWEDFWELQGIFAMEHFDDSPWDYWIEQPQHPRSRGMSRALPSFAFESLADLRAYLSQFYTEMWLDTEMISPDMGNFAEYDGAFYVQTSRAGTVRPNWGTAVHDLVEQFGNHAVVNTTVFMCEERLQAIVYHVIFVDGKIDFMRGAQALG